MFVWSTEFLMVDDFLMIDRLVGWFLMVDRLKVGWLVGLVDCFAVDGRLVGLLVASLQVYCFMLVDCSGG